MKKIILLLIVFASCSQAPFTDDDLGRNVFDALKNNDAEALLNCIVNEEDVSYAENHPELSPKNKSRLKRKIKHHADHWKNNYKKEFAKIQDSPFYKAIDWETAVYDKTENDEDIRNGLPQSDIHVILHDKTGVKIIKLDDCIKTNRGWRLMDEVNFDE